MKCLTLCLPVPLRPQPLFRFLPFHPFERIICLPSTDDNSRTDSNDSSHSVTNQVVSTTKSWDVLMADGQAFYQSRLATRGMCVIYTYTYTLSPHTTLSHQQNRRLYVLYSIIPANFGIQLISPYALKLLLPSKYNITYYRQVLFIGLMQIDLISSNYGLKRAKYKTALLRKSLIWKFIE